MPQRSEIRVSSACYSRISFESIQRGKLAALVSHVDHRRRNRNVGKTLSFVEQYRITNIEYPMSKCRSFRDPAWLRYSIFVSGPVKNSMKSYDARRWNWISNIQQGISNEQGKRIGPVGPLDWRCCSDHKFYEYWDRQGEGGAIGLVPWSLDIKKSYYFY